MKILVDKLPIFPTACLFSRMAHGQSVCDIEKNDRYKKICNIRTCDKLITLNEALRQQDQINSKEQVEYGNKGLSI